MARHIRVFPIVDAPEKTFPQIQQYLTKKGFRRVTRDGEDVFQKGDGFWVAPRFVKVTYFGGYVRLEAWIDAMGAEHGLEGFVGAAAKGPIKKASAYIEQVLTRPGEGYEPQAATQEQAGEYCAKCGARLGQRYCASCGHIPGEPIPTKGAAEGIPAGVQVSKREYLKKYAGDSFNTNLRTTAIVGYVLCGIQALTILANPYVLADLAICLSLTLGMHLGRSKGCAIGILVYAVVSMLIGLLSSGVLGGWGWLIVGIYGLVIFNNAEKRYKELTTA